LGAERSAGRSGCRPHGVPTPPDDRRPGAR
jgi:hypothetical protein